MKLNTNSSELIATTGKQSSNFQIQATEKTFQILSANLYTDKIGAVVREYLCNALDIHKRHKVKRPFDVTLPTTFSNTWTVRDYAVGLSEEDIIHFYCTYFASDKSASNNEIGGFGLGCKAGFAYSNSFIVTSWHKGFKTRYIMSLSSGIPSCIKGTQIPSDEPSGLAVSINVDVKDIPKFIQKTQEIVEIFPTKYFNHLKKDEFLNLKNTNLFLPNIYKRKNDNNHFIMGNVAYHIPNLQDAMQDFFIENPEYPVIVQAQELLEKYFSTKTFKEFIFNSDNFIIKLPNGLLIPHPSRELLELTPEKNSIFFKYLAKLYLNYAKHLQNIIESNIKNDTLFQNFSSIKGEFSLKQLCTFDLFFHKYKENLIKITDLVVSAKCFTNSFNKIDLDKSNACLTVFNGFGKLKVTAPSNYFKISDLFRKGSYYDLSNFISQTTSVYYSKPKTYIVIVSPNQHKLKLLTDIAKFYDKDCVIYNLKTDKYTDAIIVKDTFANMGQKIYISAQEAIDTLYPNYKEDCISILKKAKRKTPKSRIVYYAYDPETDSTYDETLMMSHNDFKEFIFNLKEQNYQIKVHTLHSDSLTVFKTKTIYFDSDFLNQHKRAFLRKVNPENLVLSYNAFFNEYFGKDLLDYKCIYLIAKFKAFLPINIANRVTFIANSKPINKNLSFLDRFNQAISLYNLIFNKDISQISPELYFILKFTIRDLSSDEDEEDAVLQDYLQRMSLSLCKNKYFNSAIDVLLPTVLLNLSEYTNVNVRKLINEAYTKTDSNNLIGCIPTLLFTTYTNPDIYFHPVLDNFIGEYSNV